MQPMPSEIQPFCSIIVGAESGPMMLPWKCLFWVLNIFWALIDALIENNWLKSAAVKCLVKNDWTFDVFSVSVHKKTNIPDKWETADGANNKDTDLIVLTTHLAPVEGAVLNPEIYQCHLIWTKFQFSWVGDANIGWEISLIWNALGVFWHKWVCAQIH